jgi:hypothetical protein
MIPLSPGPAVRAAGPAVAAGLPAGTSRRWPLRVALVAATDVVARRFGRPGISFVSITPGEGKQFSPAAQLAADGAGTAGWVGGVALLTAAVDRLPIPRPAAGLLLGVAVYTAETQAQAAADRARARAAIAATT